MTRDNLRAADDPSGHSRATLVVKARSTLTVTTPVATAVAAQTSGAPNASTNPYPSAIQSDACGGWRV
jgi:hypothetical protein